MSQKISTAVMAREPKPSGGRDHGLEDLIMLIIMAGIAITSVVYYSQPQKDAPMADTTFHIPVAGARSLKLFIMEITQPAKSGMSTRPFFEQQHKPEYPHVLVNGVEQFEVWAEDRTDAAVRFKQTRRYIELLTKGALITVHATVYQRN